MFINKLLTLAVVFWCCAGEALWEFHRAAGVVFTTATSHIKHVIHCYLKNTGLSCCTDYVQYHDNMAKCEIKIYIVEI